MKRAHVSPCVSVGSLFSSQDTTLESEIQRGKLEMSAQNLVQRVQQKQERDRPIVKRACAQSGESSQRAMRTLCNNRNFFQSARI